MGRRIKRKKMQPSDQIDYKRLVKDLEQIPLRDRLKLLRGLHNLSQSDLAEKLNMSRSGVASWEAPTVGVINTSEPRRAARLALSHLFRVPAELFTQTHQVDVDDYHTLLQENEGKTEQVPVQTDQREEAAEIGDPDTMEVPQTQTVQVQEPLPRDRPNTVTEMGGGVRRIT